MIQKLNDSDLLLKTSKLVQTERDLLVTVLDHLQEIFRRRLFCDLGHSSLFKYLVKELKYSEAAASRRVSALILIRRMPRAKEMISRGELNLTSATLVERATRRLDISDSKKILEKAKNKSKRELQKILCQLTKGDAAAEKNPNIYLLDATLKKLEQYKALKKLTSQEALDSALDIAIHDYYQSLTKIKSSKGTKGRAIPAATKKKVLLRAHCRCEYPGCTEFRNLEFEHKLPFAAGGAHHPSNIMLYCRSHNQRQGIFYFGQKYMDAYLN